MDDFEGKSEIVEVANCSKKGRKYGKCPPCTLTYAAKKESIVRGKLPCGVQYIFFVKVALISLNYTTPNERETLAITGCNLQRDSECVDG